MRNTRNKRNVQKCKLLILNVPQAYLDILSNLTINIVEKQGNFLTQPTYNYLGFQVACGVGIQVGDNKRQLPLAGIRPALDYLDFLRGKVVELVDKAVNLAVGLFDFRDNRVKVLFALLEIGGEFLQVAVDLWVK